MSLIAVDFSMFATALHYLGFALDPVSLWFKRVYRFCVLLFFTAIAKAFLVPTITTSFRPRRQDPADLGPSPLQS
jgi:hypothetical protein